jgi:sugar transport protein
MHESAAVCTAGGGDPADQGERSCGWPPLPHWAAYCSAANFLVTISFLTLLNAITNAGTFFVFTFLTVVALMYFWRRVPETKGLRLDGITAHSESAPRTPLTYPSTINL